MRKQVVKPAGELTPEEVLWAFFRDYRQLTRDLNREDRAAERAGRELDCGPFEERLRAILAAHCTPRPRPRSEALSWGTPEYDPRTERLVKVVHESARRAVVYTKQLTGFESERRFVLLRVGGRWLVDNVQLRVGRKWERVCL
jgi:hypothetical protein